MALDIRTIEALAPDQPSLKAAAGLTKPAKWSGIASSPDGTLMWGLCAGSGSNPYKVAVDLRDNGAKCTCPSRKFPCKHGLALMWMKAESMTAFPADETPEWVGDWLKRRRGAPAGTSYPDKSATDASAEAAAEPVDEKAAAKKEAAAAKRAAETEASVTDALKALEQWISDQLRTGLSGFMDDATARCRRIASRMVDGKAQALAARIDEMPGRILGVPVGDRTRIVVDELAKLTILSRAYRNDPKDSAARRAVINAENRDALLTDPSTLKVTSEWEVLAERIATRRDGLISQTTWLLNLGEGPRFAMLVDFHAASAGRRGNSFVQGEQFCGTMAFYRSDDPLRALLVTRDADITDRPWRTEGTVHVSAQADSALMAEPWREDTPIMLPKGRITQDAKGANWWRSACRTATHPVDGKVPDVARGAGMNAAIAMWSAGRLAMLAGETAWGKVRFDV
jgi:hypothetical protein